MRAVPKPYPREFRDDVVRVARNRESGKEVKQSAADFGISESAWRLGEGRRRGGHHARNHRDRERR
ncbi:MAG: hypothetical protein EOO27_41490, partial [Comamonadaceae bacterium]